MAEQDFDIKIRTTADTAGIAQTSAQLDALKEKQTEQQRASAETASTIGRLIGQFAGAATVYGIIDNIKSVAQQITQISNELAKQGEQLTKNGQKYTEQASAATNEADIIKVANSALKDVEAAHERVKSTQQEEVALYNKITDSIYHGVIQLGLMGRAGDEAGRISKHALELQIAGQQQLEDIARQNLIGAIRTGEAYKEAFERRKAEPLDDAIEKIVTNLGDLETQLKGIDYTKFPESWLATAKNIESAKGQLAGLIQLQKQAQAAADAAARPLAKAELTPTGQYVASQVQADREHQAQRAALEQKRREAVAVGDTERQHAIENELKHDRFGRDQRKEALQRYVANQESLFKEGPGESQGQMIKDIGRLGAQKYEAAKAELEKIYGAQKAEMPGGAAGGDSETHRLLEQLVRLWQ